MGMPTVNSVGAVQAATTALTIPPGASHTADDIDIILVETGGGTLTLDTAAGFAALTAVNGQTTGAGALLTSMWVFWRRWNGTDGSPVTSAPTNHGVGRMISISGCKTTGDPWNTTATGTTDASEDTTVSVAGGTTSVADCLILKLVAQSKPDALTTTELSNWANADLATVTEQIDNTTNQGNGGAIGLATGEKATGGTFGATTADAVTASTRVCAMVALEGASAGGTQSLTGSLFTKAPTFFTGTVTATRTLTGTLFTKAPTFFTGTITATRALTGVLFTKAPTFPTGAVSLAAGPQTLTGSLFAKAPTFPTGTVAASYALTGTLFVKAPTFPQGAVTTGAVTLTGTLFVKAPTFPQGAISAGAVTLTGVLFQKAPTFPTGTVTAGAINLTGVLFVNAPTFFTGTIGQAGTLFGTLYVNTPIFFTGTMGQLGGSFWRPNPVAYTLAPVGYTPIGPNDIPPWGIDIEGVLFVKAPTFPVGAVS